MCWQYIEAPYNLNLEDLVLMPEVDARRVLLGRRLSFSVLAPVGAYAGVGTLRVLRADDNPGDARVELVCGYERYESVER